MPRFDKTGPRGKGPKTGRGLGYCKLDKEYEKETKDYEKETKNVAQKAIDKILGGK